MTRALLQELVSARPLHRSASTMPRGETPSISQAKGSGIRAVVCAVSVMGQDDVTHRVVANPATAAHVSAEQCRPALAKAGAPRFATPAQATAYRKLRALPVPFSAIDVANALGCQRSTAERWLAFFKRDGRLVGTRAGHVWAGEMTDRRSA